MYSVSNDPLASGATGLRTARRDLAGNPLKNPPTGDVIDQSRPDTVNTDWDAAAQTRQQKVVDGSTAVRVQAEAFKAKFEIDQANADAADKLAATDLSDHVLAKFAGILPDVMAEITKVAGTLHEAEASLVDLQTQLPLAKDYVTECTATAATMPAWVTDKAKAVTDAHAAADVAVTNDNTNLAKQKARDEALAARDEFASFQAELQKRFDQELADATDLEARVGVAMVKADTAQKDAAAALADKLNAAGLADSDPDVAELIAKAKAKAMSSAVLLVETAKADNAAVALAAAQSSEDAAKEDLAILQDGGYSAFVEAKVNTEKAARKQQFADVTATGANANDKRALLQNALDQQLLDVDDVAKLVADTRKREDDAATAHLATVKGDHDTCDGKDNKTKLAVAKAEADLKAIDDRIAAVDVSAKPLSQQRDEAAHDAAQRKLEAEQARAALASPDLLPATLDTWDAGQCRSGADDAKLRKADAESAAKSALASAADEELNERASKEKQTEVAARIATNDEAAKALSTLDPQAEALPQALQGRPTLAEAFDLAKEAEGEEAALADRAKESAEAADRAKDALAEARRIHTEIAEREAAAAAVGEELAGADREWNAAAGPLADANRKLEAALAEEVSLEAALKSAPEAEALALAQNLRAFRDRMDELRTEFDAAEEALSEEARARMEEIEARISEAEALRDEIAAGMDIARSQAAALDGSLDDVAAKAAEADLKADDDKAEAEAAASRAAERKNAFALQVEAAVEATEKDGAQLAADLEDAKNAEAASRKAGEDAQAEAEAETSAAKAEEALAVALDAEALLREADQALAGIEDAQKATADRPAVEAGMTAAKIDAEQAKEALEAADRKQKAAIALNKIREDVAKDQKASDKANTGRARAELALAAAEVQRDQGIAADGPANARSILIAAADVEVETRRAQLAQTQMELRKATARLAIAQADRDKARQAHDDLGLALGAVLPDTAADAALKKADKLHQNLDAKIVPAVKAKHDDLTLALAQREAEVLAAEQARALI